MLKIEVCWRIIDYVIILILKKVFHSKVEKPMGSKCEYICKTEAGIQLDILSYNKYTCFLMCWLLEIKVTFYLCQETCLSVSVGAPKGSIKKYFSRMFCSGKQGHLNTW